MTYEKVSSSKISKFLIRNYEEQNAMGWYLQRALGRRSREWGRIITSAQNLICSKFSLKSEKINRDFIANRLTLQ